MDTRTKIGATLGPACQTQAIISKMVQAGMDFARLNFSHGTHQEHQQLINNVRAIEKKFGHPVAILSDLQGPHIRVGDLPSKGVKLKTGDKVTLASGAAKKNADIPVGFFGLENFLKKNERILIDDGKVEILVTNVNVNKITGQVIEGGIVHNHKGMNFPDSILEIPVLATKDKADVRFAVKAGVDMISLSFISRAKDILDLRYFIKQVQKEEKLEQKPIFVVAKIERHEAVDNIAEILEVADAIMIARGDLGLELPKQEVPLIQKRIIDEASAKATPVIVATQLLDSMRENKRPTRAEVSDVANAVIDHVDGLLLTNETAAGKHPVHTIETMTEVITATEKSHYDDLARPIIKETERTERAITELSRILAEAVNANLILAASLTGETGRLISRVRPELPILVATESEIVWRQLNLSWGVESFILPHCNSIEEFVDRSISHIKKQKLAKKGEKIIIVTGQPVGQAGNVNLVEVREVK
jgi:pyruvate kinase